MSHDATISPFWSITLGNSVIADLSAVQHAQHPKADTLPPRQHQSTLTNPEHDTPLFVATQPPSLPQNKAPMSSSSSTSTATMLSPSVAAAVATTSNTGARMLATNSYTSGTDNESIATQYFSPLNESASSVYLSIMSGSSSLRTTTTSPTGNSPLPTRELASQLNRKPFLT